MREETEASRWDQNILPGTKQKNVELRLTFLIQRRALS